MLNEKLHLQFRINLYIYLVDKIEELLKKYQLLI